MEVKGTTLPGVLLIRPRRFTDPRGWFEEVWNHSKFANVVGAPVQFAQDNRSASASGTLRGIHYQLEPSSQGKLVTCLAGRIRDLAVDLRRSSDTFGEAELFDIDAESGWQVWIPEGYGHGFLALSDCEVFYKATAPYDPTAERTIRWNDPHIAANWRTLEPTLSERDAAAPFLDQADLFD